MQLPPPDAILSNVYKAFEECFPIKRFQNKHNTKHFKIIQNAKHFENEFLKSTEKRSQNNHNVNYIQNKVLKHNSKAFTLAEVLIALVIIGIIAAITVPTIISNVEERERTARVKKVYATLANAMTRVKADGGDMIFDVVNENTENIKSWYDTYLKKYLITTKVCYDTKGCWNSGDTKFMKGSIATWNYTGKGVGNNIVTAILNDGTFINLDAYYGNEIINIFGVTTNSTALVILFDINGEKKPNTIGKDIFVTVFTENGFVPAYKDKTKAQIDNDCSSSGTGYSCIQKYLNK